MTSIPADSPKRLIDMEFEPGQLPPATPRTLNAEADEPLVEAKAPITLTTKVALASAGMLLLIVIVDAAVTFGRRAVLEGGVLDLALLAALVVFLLSVGLVLVGQVRS